jgi:hypothetical protein
MSAKQAMIADTRVSWMDVGEDVVDVGEDARSALMRESAALSQMVKCFSCPLPSVKAVTFRIDARSFSRCKCSTTGSPAPDEAGPPALSPALFSELSSAPLSIVATSSALNLD